MNSTRCLINLSLLKGIEVGSGYSKKGIKNLFDGTNVELTLSFTRREFIQEQPVRQAGMSISGYQPKLSLYVENKELRVIGNGGTYILKPSPEEYPYLAENEHATMTVMRRLKFAVPPFGLMRFHDDEEHPEELAFVIKRYDRQGAARLHQEQLDGAMGIDNKYGSIDGKKGISYERAAKFLNKHISGSLENKRDFFLRVVYAYVLGNNDFHLRNVGILLPENSAPILAPVYDFVSVVPYSAAFGEYLALPLLEREENGEANAPGIDSQYGEYTGADFLLLAEGMSINPLLARRWIAEVKKNKELIFTIYRESHMPEFQREQVLQYISRRITLLGITKL